MLRNRLRVQPTIARLESSLTPTVGTSTRFIYRHPPQPSLPQADMTEPPNRLVPGSPDRVQDRLLATARQAASTLAD